MRTVILAGLTITAFGCGESKVQPTARDEESRVRAEYAKYLGMLDEVERLQSERRKDRDEAATFIKVKLAGLSQSGGDTAPAQAELQDLVSNPRPHPLDGDITKALNESHARRREYENRWKSLGIDVE